MQCRISTQASRIQRATLVIQLKLQLLLHMKIYCRTLEKNHRIVNGTGLPTSASYSGAQKDIGILMEETAEIVYLPYICLLKIADQARNDHISQQ